MRNKNDYLSMLYNQGRLDAIDLRNKCERNELTDTEIIDREEMIPVWKSDKDYTTYPAGTPVIFDG